MKEFINNRNPVLPPDYHIPDAEAHVMPDGRVYVYGSYDDLPGEYCSDRYYVVSSADLEHWRISDVSFCSAEVSWFHDPDAPRYPGGVDWMHPTPFLQKMIRKILENRSGNTAGPADAGRVRKEPLLYAPDCIYSGGRYYLYFCGSDDSEGAAVSDSPEGPFRDPVRLPCGGIDPAVFTDDDGQSYYYWGQIHARGVKLNPDMVSFEEKDVRDPLLTEEEHGFHEGSSLRKINGTYYYIYAGVERDRPTTLSYATGPSPFGPFTHQGVIIDNAACDPACWNNHGSIECIHGQWYVFYHRNSRGSEQHRRLCIEPIEILENGSIPEVKMTSQGVGKPFGPGERVMGYQACELHGQMYIDADEACAEKLTHISAGDEALFRYVESPGDFTEITVKAQGSGVMEIMMNGKRAGEVHIEHGVQTGGALHMPAGRYELALQFLHADRLEVWYFSLR